MPINILPPEVTSKIAAGEVIERPASVIKELVENSLDAGASEIAVEVQNGGISFMRVTDNGCGLSAAEAEVAILRHATSKISGLDDLERIHTLGFRGEALPSIASVAEMEILTRDRDSDAAIYLRLENGRIAVREKKSRPQGTTITVRHLFRNFPARLKFLKSPVTESGHIATLIGQYALAYPETRFRLTVDGRTTLHTPGDSDMRSSVSEVYGLEIARSMLDVEASDGFLHIQGLTSPPSVLRSSRNYLSFFVNRRYVRNSILGRAVETAYSDLLMNGRHPVTVLNIAIPPGEVDVNVHPTKLEVKFRNNHEVFRAVVKSLRDTLSHAPLPAVSGGGQDALSPSLWEVFPRSGSGLPTLQPLGQLSASYILAEGDEGLFLIDQHAAHERILFDRIMARRAERKPDVQGMLEPLSMELSPAQEAACRQCGGLLAELGFILEPFGERTWLVRAVPALLNGTNPAAALHELLDNLAAEQDISRRDVVAARILACHGAVRAGQTLSTEEMKDLLKQLESTLQPRTCPHGRPTMIHLSAQQLKKEFGRTG